MIGKPFLQVCYKDIDCKSYIKLDEYFCLLFNHFVRYLVIKSHIIHAKSYCIED